MRDLSGYANMTANHDHAATRIRLIAAWRKHYDLPLVQARDEVDAALAAAEQRGAARAFKESANEVRREMRWQYEQNINRNSDTGDSIDRLLELEKVFKYRADLMENDHG